MDDGKKMFTVECELLEKRRFEVSVLASDEDEVRELIDEYSSDIAWDAEGQYLVDRHLSVFRWLDEEEADGWEGGPGATVFSMGKPIA